MPNLVIDGDSLQISESVSGIDHFKANKEIVALRVNGELKDLATDLATLPDRSEDVV